MRRNLLAGRWLFGQPGWLGGIVLSGSLLASSAGAQGVPARLASAGAAKSDHGRVFLTSYLKSTPGVLAGPTVFPAGITAGSGEAFDGRLAENALAVGRNFSAICRWVPATPRSARAESKFENGLRGPVLRLPGSEIPVRQPTSELLTMAPVPSGAPAGLVGSEGEPSGPLAEQLPKEGVLYVPEPSLWSLGMLGMGGACFVRRRKTAARAS